MSSACAAAACAACPSTDQDLERRCNGQQTLPRLGGISPDYDYDAIQPFFFEKTNPLLLEAVGETAIRRVLIQWGETAPQNRKLGTLCHDGRVGVICPKKGIQIFDIESEKWFDNSAEWMAKQSKEAYVDVVCSARHVRSMDIKLVEMVALNEKFESEHPDEAMIPISRHRAGSGSCGPLLPSLVYNPDSNPNPLLPSLVYNPDAGAEEMKKPNAEDKLVLTLEQRKDVMTQIVAKITTLMTPNDRDWFCKLSWHAISAARRDPIEVVHEVIQALTSVRAYDDMVAHREHYIRRNRPVPPIKLHMIEFRNCKEGAEWRLFIRQRRLVVVSKYAVSHGDIEIREIERLVQMLTAVVEALWETASLPDDAVLDVEVIQSMQRVVLFDLNPYGSRSGIHSILPWDDSCLQTVLPDTVTYVAGRRIRDIMSVTVCRRPYAQPSAATASVSVATQTAAAASACASAVPDL